MKKYEVEGSKHLIVNEPNSVYGKSDFFLLANKFISKDYIKQVLNKSRLTIEELIDILPISIDTYKRKAEFNPSVTEKILEIEEVYQKGLEAFGEGFHQWMNAENIALGGLKPKFYLKNSFGVRKLIDQIGRMEHGVLA